MFKSARAFSFCCLIALTVSSPAFASEASLSQQLDAIFNKHAYVEKNVQLAWLNNGEEYTILEAPANGGKGLDIVAYETASGKRRVLVAAAKLVPSGQSAPLEIQDYSWSPDKKSLLVYTNSKKVWRANTRGDYWLYDMATGKLTKLGGDAPESTLMFATISPDSRRAAYVRANNLYVEELATGKIVQLTTDGSADIINGTSDWVSEEELKLRNCFRWSPDSRSIAYWQFDQSGVGEYTLINDTRSEYPETVKYKYPQPGTTNSAVRAGVVPVSGGPTRWIRLEGDSRNHYIAQLEWAGNSNEVMIEYLNRLQNTAQIMLANAGTGDARLFFEDTDKAWVDHFPLDWIEDGHGGTSADLLWLSERDGWRHAYRVDRKTGQPRLITNFQADLVAKAGIDSDAGWLYFTASPAEPVRLSLYRTRLDGQGTPERVTPNDQPGFHAYDIAPNGRWAVHRYSTFNRPNRIEIVHLPDHKAVRTLVDNDELARKVQPLIGKAEGNPNTEFFEVPVANGITLNGYMIRPPDFDPKKKYPVLVNVYGEPASTTVRDAWGNNGRLFHALIAQQGYLVISFDNEGTPAPKGREWRKCVYGAVGVLSSAQQTQAIRELARERSYIDTSRMAIWGWSGGGSNTLNVMFRYPGVFSTGIAVAPVADESHYDTVYQERYMGLPEANRQGYHDGSPINFASGLAGHLLVVHGSGDDNVHFQGTELLINKLVELGKPFDFMDYPNRTHSISEGPGTSFHVYSLIARYLEEHVPAGGVAQ
ncbi:dipeptidyl-peptidase-4 [Silvibacterium bohemicum]|uniref:Dipeptidyl-peptidase-4 n=1 Tax=Silvibacterium bohemicum TaxID=1577686 RepID=A0A841JLI3_9BACT|nr:S9 family peptidase [Silvibacterium bohemicum]MBB6142222.1 dipeptidyl-peptidase-4 [Silvibacterium bohemicum]